MKPSRRSSKSGRRSEVTRRTTARTAQPSHAPTKRTSHAGQGRRCSVGTRTRSRLGARSTSPAPALTELSRRCNEEGRRGDVIRRTAARTARRVFASTKRTARARRVRQRSVGTTTRSLLDAGSASPALALTEPSRRCDEEDRHSDVTRRTAARAARRARASTKRSARARRGRRRSVGTTTRSRLGAGSASPAQALTELSRRSDEQDRRGDATRCTAARAARCARASTKQLARVRRGPQRTIGTTTNFSRLGARSASPELALIEPSRRSNE